jgi:NADPH-dependent 2,4-dienoyl-CoA reductase/sulfur reductase-like enzyme
MKTHKIIVIGGGPAGLAAAAEAKRSGVDDILIIERDGRLGGILNQCIHNGFGLHAFKEELTGPEYAARFVSEIDELGIGYMLNTMVLDISGERTITVLNPTDGLMDIRAGAIILAMGCRERPRGALNIPGYRPAGIYSAGTAQRLVNIEGYMPGSEIVILGSGDIGLIMARRLTLEGAKVKVVAEILPYSSGLKRNVVQCLDDFGIPLRLSHTVVDIKGRERVEGVTIAAVDENRRPINGTEEHFPCDTLLLSVGLIPENELSNRINVTMDPVTNGPVVNESLETSVDGVFACGNVLHVHDLVDYVSEEAAIAGRSAAKYVTEGTGGQRRDVALRASDGVGYTVPMTIDTDRMDDAVKVRFRVRSVFKDHFLGVYYDGERVEHRKKRIMTPGEMEEVTIKKSSLQRQEGIKEITIKVERSSDM